MGEVTIGGNVYTIKKLDARRQFHVARRVMPIMGALVGIIQTQGQVSLESALPAMADQLAAMPDADANYVLDACLSVCQRQSENHNGGIWSPVMAANGRMMFEDIELPEMLQLMAAVIQDNIGPFFSAVVPTGSPAAEPQPA